MEYISKDQLLMELIDKPVLCVENGIITNLNAAATQMQIPIGTHIDSLLGEYADTYHGFASGQLAVTLTIADIPSETTVFRTKEADWFVLDSMQDQAKLESIALAAQQLRFPLNDVLILTDQLLSHKDLDAECKLRIQAQKISKGLFRLLRMVGNMADAQRYIAKDPLSTETVNLSAFFQETCEKASCLLSDTGIRLEYTGLSHPIFGLINVECLERGVYNMLSNAVKFSPKGETVSAKLIQSDNCIRFSIYNRGATIPHNVFSNLFTRFTRQPGIEDGRHGIGIGMTMIRTAATAHGGTVLIDSPDEGGTRVTLTIPLRVDTTGTVHSPVVKLIDYAGGWDHGLVELADSISADKFGE